MRRGGLLIAPDAIIDGGPARVGVESTIVKVDRDGVTLLRPGGVARADIEAIIGAPLRNPPQTDKPQAPGMLASHYAPTAAVRLNAQDQRDGEAFLGFGDIAGGDASMNLSEAGDLREAAATLFRCLHALDALCAEQGLETIAVAPIPRDGLGEAINDRLARAAAPRE